MTRGVHKIKQIKNNFVCIKKLKNFFYKYFLKKDKIQIQNKAITKLEQSKSKVKTGLIFLIKITLNTFLIKI